MWNAIPRSGSKRFQGTHQRQAGNLKQIVEWLCRASKLVREAASERHHLLQELIACTAVAVPARPRDSERSRVPHGLSRTVCASSCSSQLSSRPLRRRGSTISAAEAICARRIGPLGRARVGRDQLVLSQHRQLYSWRSGRRLRCTLGCCPRKTRNTLD